MLNLHIVPFHRSYNREAFCSQSPELNHYLQRQVSQDIKRNITSCFLALTDDEQIAGYYTLSAYSIAFDELSPDIQKKLPHYPQLPALLMGRLATDSRYLGQGVGKSLLLSALHRAKRLEVASFALLVEAKNQQAIDFYQYFGFTVFQSADDKLYYPLSLFQAK